MDRIVNGLWSWQVWKPESSRFRTDLRQTVCARCIRGGAGTFQQSAVLLPDRLCPLLGLDPLTGDDPPPRRGL